MVNIPKINKASTNGEVDATTKAINVALAKNDWSFDAFLTGIITTLIALYENLNEAIKRGKAESELEEKDMTRDKALSELFNLVKGFASISGTAGDGARVVMAILDKYGLSKTARANYANESAYINSMLTDLKVAEIAAIIGGLPFVQDAILKLEHSQNEFEQAHNDYMVAMATDSTKNSATAIKGEVMKVINEDLVDYLKTMSKVNPDTYAPTSTEIAEIITDNNTRVKNRKA
ncbi:MAG: DUF6261 family protein [Bacteroidales bacterium]